MKFFLNQILLFITVSGFTQIDNYQEKLWTLTRVYGVVKYYNNEKDDRYLDDELIKVFSRLKDADYSVDKLNADILKLLPSDQRILNSGAKLKNPFDQFESTDHKRIVDFSWIDENQTLSENNKKLLWQLIYSHKKISNSNIKKKTIYIHKEKDVPKSLTGTNLYLFGLIKFWNVIEYFFPYKPLMDEDWGAVFYAAIPGFQSIKSDIDYLTILKKLSAKLNDSHVFVEDERINDIHVSKLPFIINVFENQMVIKNINDSLSSIYQIETGDVIEEIDGKGFSELYREFSELTSYSTPQAGRNDFKAYLFLRSNYNDSTFSATIKSGNRIHNESITTIELADYIKFKSNTNNTSSFYSISDNIGYIDYDDLSYADLGKAIRKLKKKNYLILDCRGHNYGLSILRLLNFLGNTNVQFAKVYQPNHNYPGIFSDPKEVRHRILPKLRSPYKGKIIVLINEEIVSAMESLLMAIEIRRPDAVFIGSPTQGCNGQMNLMELPGERAVWFTGQGDWQYPDGSQFQRIGIQPDIFVEPTIKSIFKNEDIILNKAIEFISNK